ncbi:unnamed protein product [Cuscuta epithymum]|uniref:DUF4283 domain-containing protein n=1 Tax=Cuscuta epithymum TaxID=186058 RepID=A0AAV0GHA3_9ASTE|nr:unnamed protein product [Cuscuta epithymum]
MGRTKQGPGDASLTRTTRSRFSVLQGSDEEFPPFNAANLVKLPENQPGNQTPGNFGKTPNAYGNGLTGKIVAGAIPEELVSPATKPASSEASAKPALKATNATSEALHAETPTATKPGKGKNAAKKPTLAVTDNAQAPIQPTLAVTTDAQAAQPKVWNALFKDNRDPRHGIKLRYVPPKGETLDFGDRVLPSMVEMWGYCLVGHFTGKFPGLKAVHDLKSTWGVRCLVRSHNKGWVIFKFTNEEDRLKVLHDGPYTVFGKLLMLKELSDDFSFEDEEFLKVPIWVKFPKLPMKLWNDEAMSEVASMIGVPITTDKITQDRANNDFARVLIEVDVSKPPPLSFPIRLPSSKVIKQSVLYETFPNYCFHCKDFGHHPFICKNLAKRVDGESDNKEPSVVTNKDVVSEATQTEVAAQKYPTGGTADPTGPVKTAAVAAHAVCPTGHTSNPTGSTAQSAAATLSVTVPAAQGLSKVDKASEVVLKDVERTVMDQRDVKQNDVVIKCEIINGKTLKLVVKPFRFVQASVIRVDTSLRLTDDLDRKGLTFTAKCLEGLPGVTKKKGEVCFDSKFTTPFRCFLGC